MASYASIQPNGKFSAQYITLSQMQAPECDTCMTRIVRMPEDMCVKCLVEVAKQMTKVWFDNNLLHKQIMDIKEAAAKFKTKLCNNWESTGECPLNEKCKFAHGIDELRQLPPEWA